MAKQLNYQINLNVNKNDLNDLLKSLKQIQQDDLDNINLGALNSDLSKAANEAHRLEIILNKSWNSKLGQWDLTKLNQEIKTTYGNVQKLKDVLEKNNMGQQFNTLQSSVLSTNLQLKQSNKLLDTMATSMANTVKWGITSNIFNNVANQIQKAWDYSVKLDTSLNDIRIVTDKSADEMERFARTANKAAQNLGTSTKDYTDAALIYYQQGLGDAETQARTETTLKAANVTGQTGQEVSEQLTAIWNGYKVTADEAELYIDKVAKVAATSAADLEEMATGMSKVASAAKSAGVDIDQLNATLATVISVTREAPETIGSAFRTIYARLGDLSLGKTDEEGVGLGKVSGQLHNLGIEILDQEGNMRDMGKIVEDIAAKWQTWTQAQKQAAAVAMAGKMQYSRLIALFDNWDKYTQYLNDSATAAGTLNKQQEIYMESTEAHLKKLSTEAEKTYDILFDTESVNSMTDAMTGLLSVFNNFLAGMGGGTSSIVGLLSMTGRVFNKQIGSGINQLISNKEVDKKNRESLNIYSEYANITPSDKTNLSEEEKKVYKERQEAAQQLSVLSKNLTNEEFNKLITMQKETREAELLAAKIKSMYNNQSKSLIEINADLANQKTVVQDTNRAYQAIVAQTEEQITLEELLDNLQNNKYVNQKQFTNYEDIILEGIENELSEEQIIAQVKEKALQNLREELALEEDIVRTKQAKEAIEKHQDVEIITNANNKKQAEEEEIAAQKRKVAIQDMVKGLTTLVTLGTTVSGIWKTINNEELTGWEKFEQISSTLLITSPMIISGLSSIGKILPGIAISFGTITAAELEAAKAAGTFGAALWAALWPILAIAAMVVASIAGIVWIVNTSIDSYNKSAKAAEEAGHQAEVLAQAYQDCAKAADDLNQAISKYEKGIEGLDKLTKGTDEYEAALEEANKQAQDLIAKYDLLAGKDYLIDADGVIRIKTDENSGLSNKKNELTQKMSTANSQQLAAQIRADQASIESRQLDYQRKTGIDYNSEIEKQYDRIIGGMRLIPGAGSLMAIGGSIARLSSEDRGYNLNKTEIDELTKVLSEAEEGYASILRDNEDDVRNWILNNKNLSDSVKANVDEIVKEKDALIRLISSTEAFEKSLEKASGELIINHIKNNKVLDEQLNKLSQDKETGEVNEKQKELIQKALAASESASAMKSSEESDLKLAKMAADNVKSNADLENFAKSQGLDAEALGLTGLNDKKSAEAYLKHVLGYSDEDIAHIKIEDNWGNTTAKWNSNYTDSTGTEHKSSDEIYKELNDEEARSATAYQLKVEEITKQADENAKIFLEDSTKAIQNMINNTDEMSKQYGIDFSNIILNSMAGRLNDQNATLDFTEAFNNLTDGEIDALMGMSADELANALHLTDEDFYELGYEGAAAFEQAFDKALYEKERKALLQLMNDINVIGGNGNNLSEEQYNNLAQSMTDRLNATQMQDLSSRSLSLSQIDFSSDDYKKINDQLAFMAESIEKAKDAGISLTEQQKEEAKELDYSEGALKAYAEEIQNSTEALKDNDEAAVDIALTNVRMNKGIETLQKNWENWEKVLKEGNKNSGEYYEALSQLKKATEDMFGVDVSNQFLTNAKNMQKLKELSEGNVKAFDELHDAAMQDYVAHLGIVGPDQETIDGVRNELTGMIDDIQSRGTIEIGTELDDSYVDKLNEMLAKGQVTEQQMNKILAGIGYTPTISYKKEARTTETKHEVSADIFGQKVHVGTVYDAQTSYVDVPQIEGGSGSDKKGPTYVGKPSSSGINYSQGRGRQQDVAKKGGGKKGGNGRGSESKPDTMKTVEDEKDRYHDIDIILKQISTDLDRLDKQKEKLFGQGLIDNLNKQLSTLDKQINATNEKIRIARGEAAELRNTLSAYGASFNADGTLANYTQVYTTQLNYVNSLIAQYNSMSKEAQDAFKDTVEGAKKNFDKFVEDINKYDALVSDTIPGLEDDIQDAIDKQIEIKIEEFTMEIEIRLDMSEAERDWNEFRRKVIDGIKDTDILGNTRARLRDFNSYYNSENTGEVQSLMKQVQNTQAQLEQMDRTGWSDFYGDNRAKGLEDLKSYNDQLMKSMEDVEDLIEEIKKSYLDMMDEAADKFQDQVDMYEQVKDIIDHDMNIIKLVYGEDSYADLEKYYQMQEDNNNKQLDFLRQQKDFWYAQMQTLEQGSEEWEKAKENWMDAVSEWNSKVEEAVENIQDKYLNAINKIFDELNNKVTSGAGLDYVSDEWELINQNADQYLDTINSLYGIQSLENKYLDAIDQTDNLSAQRKLNDLMNEELNALREKDKLTQYDIDRANMKYEIALKQIALEEAQQNKSTMRLRRDSQGNYTYQYVADDDQIGQLQDELTTLKNELYNFDLEHYRDNLDQVLEIYQEFQEKMKEAAQINDPEERAAMELLLQEQYGELINGLVEQNETIRLNLHESAFTELADLYNTDLNNFQSLTSEEQEVLLGQMIPQWDSGIQHMADTFAGEGGFIPTCKNAMEQLNAATETYEQDLNQVQQAAGQNFGDVQRGIDDTKTKTEELIQDNGALIQTYQDQLNAIQSVINELQSLCSQYSAVKIAAQQAAEAAYNYWRAVNGEAANAAGNNVSGGNSNSGNSSSNSRGSNNSSSGGAGSVGGDGATIGNQITYSGSYYYDSFGTKPSGSKYSGVADGVTIDIVNNNPYGIHIKSSDGRYPDLGWIKRNQVTRWNTGGYTGDWGDDSGRLAILDRKELILNKDDTANMLNILQLTRDFMNSMNNVLLSRMINSVNGAPNTGMGMVNEDTLEQNVHIDATFPNVKDAREVEEALNNLVNVASQRIGRNTKR